MTAAPQFERRNHGRNHSYWLDGVKLDGVTTLINGGLPKQALMRWHSDAAADYAIDHWDELAELPLSERRKRIAKAPNSTRDAAAAKGTRVHALADKLAHGEEVAVPEELAGHVESYVKFLDDYDVRTIYTERPVYHEKYRYGGTFDLMALLNLGDEVWMLDPKTNRSGPYGDTAFQLAAYGNATHFLHPDGTVQRMPKVHRYGVVWVRADGYDLHPYTVNDFVFKQFLYIQQVARAAAECRDYRGDALTPPAREEVA